MSTILKTDLPFLFQRVTLSEWNFPHTKHSHFEIILIEKGRGIHNINDKPYNYSKFSIFIINPEDYHYFIIKEETTFLYIRFSEEYFFNNRTPSCNSKWKQKFESIVFQPNLIPGLICFNDNDKKLIFLLCAQVENEFNNPRSYSKEIITNIIGIVLSIVAQSIYYTSDKCESLEAEKDFKANLIINYIRQNIYNRNELNLKNIAAHFNMSEYYIGKYFKKETGISLKGYIQNYRLNLVTYRLQRSKQQLSDIAIELGYFDLSHLSRDFKKKFKISPNDYRRMYTDEKEEDA